MSPAKPPIVVKVGPNDTRITVTSRTPRAVVAAARTAVDRLNVEDLRVVANWSSYESEDTWIPYADDGSGRIDLSIVGVLAVWIACAVVDVDLPSGIDDEADQEFVRRVWAMSPRQIRA